MEPAQNDQDSVNYRVGDETMNCGACKNFDGNAACAIVQGVISAMGICDLYAPKADSISQDAGADGDLLATLFGSM